MNKYEIKIELTDILGKGKCPGGHTIGEGFNYPEEKGKICPSAFRSIFPTIRIMQSGGKISWFDTPESHLQLAFI